MVDLLDMVEAVVVMAAAVVEDILEYLYLLYLNQTPF